LKRIFFLFFCAFYWTTGTARASDDTELALATFGLTPETASARAVNKAYGQAKADNQWALRRAVENGGGRGVREVTDRVAELESRYRVAMDYAVSSDRLLANYVPGDSETVERTIQIFVLESGRRTFANPSARALADFAREHLPLVETQPERLRIAAALTSFAQQSQAVADLIEQSRAIYAEGLERPYGNSGLLQSTIGELTTAGDAGTAHVIHVLRQAAALYRGDRAEFYYQVVVDERIAGHLSRLLDDVILAIKSDSEAVNADEVLQGAVGTWLRRERENPDRKDYPITSRNLVRRVTEAGTPCEVYVLANAG
jgi:hypothetical protein